PGRSVQLVAGRGHGLVYSLAQNRFAEVLAAHVERAGARTASAATRADQRCATAFGFAVAGNRSQDFRRAGVNQARGDTTYRFGVAFLHAAQPKLVQAKAAAAHRRALIVTAKLGDGAEDDRVHSQHAPDLGRRGRIGAVAVREVLLGQNFVQLFAFDDAVLPVLDQFLHQEIGHAFAHVLVGAPDGGHVRT